MATPRLAAFFLALLGVQPLPASADTFPSRPVEMTVLWSAGTAPDVVGRALAEGMARHLGQPVVVLNKPGAGGAVAYRHVAAQKPDGYSVVILSNSISTAYHTGTLPFDHTALTPIAQVSIESPIIVVRSDAPYNNLSELIRYAKENPGKLRVGNSGVGSHLQLASESFFATQNADVAHIPFGSSFSVTSLLGGHIDASATLPGSVASHVSAGSVKVLGVLATRRDPTFPDVPTATEQGHEYSADMWRGVAGPKGMPSDVVKALEEAVRLTLEEQEFKQRGQLSGFVPTFQPHDAFATTIEREDAVIAQALQKLGLKTSK